VLAISYLRAPISLSPFKQTMSSPSLETLQTTFKGDLVVPSDAEYPKAITRWANNAQRNSKVVAFVKDADDIVLAIKFAKDHQLPIAIRSGGHDTSGSSSSEGGLVIDLSRYLNGVKVDPERKVAVVGGGAIWETVDKAAIEHGLATVAGTINHVSFAPPLFFFIPCDRY
jgi:FAD/FMN-containing dehydrogenase